MLENGCPRHPDRSFPDHPGEPTSKFRWKSALVIVRPATVVAWHRRGFAWYWTRRSRPKGGRPHVDADMGRLTREMARANPLWGAPRIHGELLKLGFEVSAIVHEVIPLARTPRHQLSTFHARRLFPHGFHRLRSS